MPVLYCNFAQAIKKNRALKTGRIYRRLYTNPHTKTCDVVMVALVILAALIQGAVLCAISISYRLARQAQLNIGLVQVIWSLNPFLQSVVDCKCLKVHKVIGALLIMACAGLTAYST